MRQKSCPVYGNLIIVSSLGVTVPCSFFCQLCMSIRTLHKKFHGLWAKIVNLRANTRDRIQIQKQLYANKSSYFGDWIRSTIFGLKLTVFDLGQRNLVGSIPRNTPTQRKKLQGAVILRDDAIMTCRPDRTFGAYCRYKQNFSYIFSL